MSNDILIFVVVLNMTVAFTGLAATQEEGYAEKEIIKLDPIIVTASRIGKRLLETPSSVSVIFQKEIKGSNAKSIPDLLKNLEGIYMYDASGVGIAGRVNMRGFWGGMSTHQLVLIDGITQNKGKDKLVNWNLIPLDNIERIEIVRGPASALYGDNAMSGVINIITKKPADISETKVSASYGSFNTQNYSLSSSRTFERLGYYLGISGKLTDGFREYCDYNSIYLDGKLDYSINDMQKLKLYLDYNIEKSGPHPWTISESLIEEDRRQARLGSENDESKNKKISASVSHLLDISNALDIKETFYYRDGKEESFYTSGSTEEYTTEQLEDENTYGLPLQLNTNPEIFGIEHFLTIGIDLERNYLQYEEYAAPYQVRGDLQKNYSVIRDKIGPYIQDEIKIFVPLKLTLGMRYDLVTFDFTDYIEEDNSKKSEMSKITPMCGIMYNYQENSGAYANYTRAFRTPTLGQMFTYGSYSNPDLNPEEATSYEVGIRHRFNDYLRTSISLYWMRLDNEIWYDFAASKYMNYGKTSHKGVETRLDYKIIEGLTGFVNYVYTRAKNESGNHEGKDLTNIPLHKGSFGLKLETKFGLKANLIVTRFGDSYIDSNNEDKLAAYTIADIKVSYEIRRWTAFLAVDNLLNEIYNSHGYKSSGVRYFNPAPGETFTAGLDVKL
jgi:TonB-dependent siderophore receptor